MRKRRLHSKTNNWLHGVIDERYYQIERGTKWNLEAIQFNSWAKQVKSTKNWTNWVRKETNWEWKQKTAQPSTDINLKIENVVIRAKELRKRIWQFVHKPDPEKLSSHKYSHDPGEN